MRNSCMAPRHSSIYRLHAIHRLFRKPANCKKIGLLVVLLLFINITARAQQVPQSEDDSIKFPSVNTNAALSYKIINSVNNTYGYDVFANGKLYIHQTGIPAMPGNEGFKTKAGAEKVAKLVVEKIKKGEMPPTVSVEEMKKLRVIK